MQMSRAVSEPVTGRGPIGLHQPSAPPALCCSAVGVLKMVTDDLLWCIHRRSPIKPLVVYSPTIPDKASCGVFTNNPR